MGGQREGVNKRNRLLYIPLHFLAEEKRFCFSGTQNFTERKFYAVCSCACVATTANENLILCRPSEINLLHIWRGKRLIV